MESDRGGPPGRVPFDDFRRQVFSRLRTRYVEARELVAGDESHSHLEWLLGNGRDPLRDDASLARNVSELVVLWLEDLVVALDEGLTSGEDGSGEGRLPNSGSRRAIAASLRGATEEFAVAFLGLPRDARAR
jgi:hypothetical protein